MIKEECEKGRMEDTREAALASRAIDDMTDAMNKLEEEVAQLEKDIKAAEEKKQQNINELAEARDLRKKENLEWNTSDKEDEEAAATVKNAENVLAGFYKDNFAFVQKSAAPEVVAGAAPPPPPPTWEGG